jgi:UDP-2,4-diacetamido-2,4,6-trideoxy-beta-L-altropyranose hydrolase
MTPTGNLLIRCDAGVAIGTGHVMRCLALAQAWRDAGGRAVFAMAESTAAVEQRILAEKMEFVRVGQTPGSQEDSDSTIECARQYSGQWIIVDGYVFGADYQARLHKAGLRLLTVDDHGRAAPYVAEIVLNQNPNATESLYRQHSPATKLLLGSRYVPLRREFVRWSEWEREIQAPARKLLVTLGGSDPHNITLRVVEALISAHEYEVQIVVGGSNPHFTQLRAALSKGSGGVHLVHDPGDMADLMAWADVAISAAGTAAWEMAFMGLPALLIVVAENQEPIARALADAGAALNLGRAATITGEDMRDRFGSVATSYEIMEKMSTRGRALIDGRGADRVVAVMVDLVMTSEQAGVSADVSEQT